MAFIQKALTLQLDRCRSNLPETDVPHNRNILVHHMLKMIDLAGLWYRCAKNMTFHGTSLYER